MSDVRSEALFPSTLEVVSTKHPASGAPLVGLVMAQRIATLTSREAVEAHIAAVRAAADAAWPMTTDELLEADARGELLRACLGCGGKQAPGSYWCAPCKAIHEPGTSADEDNEE
jgi:hypothetical protein